MERGEFPQNPLPPPPLVFLSSVSNLSADADKLAETVVPKGWPIKGEEKV